jgi:acyl-coenzyme A thioesterase PaaI-like protein
VDVTDAAKRLLESVPAHRSVGLRVVRAADASAEVATDTPESMTNVIGSLHSSGLVALLDAVGLGAIIADSPDGDVDGLLPLGRSVTVEFLAPARGRLVATCELTPAAREALRPLWAGRADKVRLTTRAEVRDDTGMHVCRGEFQWSVRRLPPRA